MDKYLLYIIAGFLFLGWLFCLLVGPPSNQIHILLFLAFFAFVMGTLSLLFNEKK